MKNIIAIIAAVAITASVIAQTAQYTTQVNTVTNLIAAVSTNTVNAYAVAVTKNENVGIQVKTQLTAAGTTGAQFKFAKSTDGTTYETTPSIVLTVANAGTTSVSAVTNVTMDGVGWIRLASMGNGDDDGVLTNTTVIYSTKPSN